MTEILTANGNLIMALGLLVGIVAAVLVKTTVGDEEEKGRYLHFIGAVGCFVSVLASAELLMVTFGSSRLYMLYLVMLLISIYGLIRNIDRFRNER